MLLGAILERLADEQGAAAALEALGDIVLLAEVTDMGLLHGESPGEYTSSAARRFAASATDEDWLSLVTAIERSADPARTMLAAMVRWSLRMDHQDGSSSKVVPAAGGCSCGGSKAGSRRDHV